MCTHRRAFAAWRRGQVSFMFRRKFQPTNIISLIKITVYALYMSMYMSMHMYYTTLRWKVQSPTFSASSA